MGIWFSSVWVRLSQAWGRRASRTARWSCLIVTLVGFSELGAAMSSGGAGAPPKGGKWDLAVALPEARQESGAVALGNLIYLIDGYGADTVPSTLVQVYDTVAKQWKQASRRRRCITWGWRRWMGKFTLSAASQKASENELRSIPYGSMIRRLTAGSDGRRCRHRAARLR